MNNHRRPPVLTIQLITREGTIIAILILIIAVTAGTTAEKSLGEQQLDGSEVFEIFRVFRPVLPQ